MPTECHIPVASPPAEDPPMIPTSKLFRLENRTILVTGGLGGLGIALTSALLESGADVVVTDIHPTPDSVKAEWNSLSQTALARSAMLDYSPLDTTSASTAAHTIKAIASKSRSTHPLRGLVACAGISGRYPALDYPVEDFRHILDVNVTGTFVCARETARVMRERGVGGSLVLIASMSGYGVNQGVATSAYNASKAALHQLCRSLAAEWGLSGSHLSETGSYPVPVIRVNTISPGYIRTEATMPTLKTNPELEQLWEKGNMLGRLSLAHEFRAPILFLLGDGSSFMTGSDVRVDGGHCAW